VTNSPDDEPPSPSPFSMPDMETVRQDNQGGFAVGRDKARKRTARSPLPFSLLPPLRVKTSPKVAFGIGLLTLGVGLGIYFRRIIDFVVPTAIALTVLVAARELGAGDFGYVAASLIAAVYGFFRSRNSNLGRSPLA
jgi:hypothetical protein